MHPFLQVIKYCESVEGAVAEAKKLKKLFKDASQLIKELTPASAKAVVLPKFAALIQTKIQIKYKTSKIME